jgi:hypothetical protein
MQPYSASASAWNAAYHTPAHCTDTGLHFIVHLNSDFYHH